MLCLTVSDEEKKDFTTSAPDEHLVTGVVGFAGLHVDRNGGASFAARTSTYDRRRHVGEVSTL